MFLARTRRSLRRFGRRVSTRSLWQAAFCAALVLVLATSRHAVDLARGAWGGQSRTALATVPAMFPGVVSSEPQPIQLALRPPRPDEKQRHREHGGRPVWAASPHEWGADAQTQTPPPIEHGIDVGPATVGLRSAGVALSSLTPVRGGKASNLANAKDPETGWPMLSLLDISGQLTIDVPCVIDRCRLTQTGGLYGVRNSSNFEFEARNCNFEATVDDEGNVAAAVILHPRTLRRCIVKGGQDGIKLGSRGGCLIEDTWVYGQIQVAGSHNDGVQAVKGEGDWDTWVIHRCRIEGPWQRATSALILQADIGNLSGVTVRDCFLSGGTYTLYTRAKNGYVISKIRVVGNVFADGSWKYGSHSNDCRDLDWDDNKFAPVTSETSPVGVNLEGARWSLR